MYEFTDSENNIIRRAASWSKWLAIVQFAAAIYSAVTLLIAGVMNWSGMLQAAIQAILAVVLWQASAALSAVVSSQGNDIQHMMTALGQLKTLFTIRIAMICFMVAMAVLGAGVMAFMFSR